MTMADTVAVMNGGRVEQLGAPDELYESPRSTFVANFLGTSNLVEAEITEVTGGQLHLRVPGADAALRVPTERCAVAEPQAGGRVLMGVRPEKISLTHADDPGGAPAAGEDDRNRLTGRIRDAGFLGVSMQYVIDTPACPEFTVYEQNVERDARLAPGAEAVLRWRPAHTFALDAAQDAEAGTVETVEEAAR